MCESGPGGHPALPLPARALRLCDPPAALRTFPRAGHAGKSLPAGPLVEDHRRLGSAAASPPVGWLFLEGAVPIPDHHRPRHRAVSKGAEPRNAGAGSILLAVLRGSLRVFTAF